jgi:hypothetical protein
MDESATTVALWPDLDHGPHELTLDWQIIGGRWECIAMRIAPAPGSPPRPLTTGDLRGIALRTVVAAGAEELSRTTLRDFLDAMDFDGERRSIESAQRRMKAGPPRPGSKKPSLEEVASVYVEAVRQHKPPTKTVKEHFDITYSAAAHKIARCREPDVGLLAPTERGVAGGIEPTADEREETP